MPCGGLTLVGPRNDTLDGGWDPSHGNGQFLGLSSPLKSIGSLCMYAAKRIIQLSITAWLAMQPFPKFFDHLLQYNFTVVGCFCYGRCYLYIIIHPYIIIRGFTGVGWMAGTGAGSGRTTCADQLRTRAKGEGRLMAGGQATIKRSEIVACSYLNYVVLPFQCNCCLLKHDFDAF